MEAKRNNKGLIFAVIVLAVMVLGLIGYIVYDKMINLEDKNDSNKQVTIEQQEKDFYNIDELVKNGYIEKVTTKETELIKITTDGVFVKFSSALESGDFVEAKNIEGTPKTVYCIDEFSYPEGYSEEEAIRFYVLTEEGNVYNSSLKNPNDEPNFVKVNDKKVLNFYKDVEIKGSELPILYMEYEDGSLMSLNLKENKTYKELNNFVDFQFTPNTGGAISLAITVDKKIYAFSEEDNAFTTEVKFNNQSIYAKEIFGKKKLVNNVEAYSDEQYQYVIDQDNKLYLITMDSNIKNIKLYTEKEVKEYKVISKDDSLYKVDIIYNDNTTETINDVVMSTLYYRNK